jgi:hypothetical protein
LITANPDCFSAIALPRQAAIVLFETLRGNHRAELARVGHNDWRRSTALRSHAKDVTDSSGVAHVCTCVTNSDNVRGRGNLVPRVNAQGEVRITSGIVAEGSATDRDITFPGGVEKESFPPDSCVVAACGGANECTTANGRVVTASSIAAPHARQLGCWCLWCC